MGPIVLDRLQQVLHLLVALSINRVVQLLEEVVILLLALFLFLFESLEVLLPLLHALFRNQVERCGHLL